MRLFLYILFCALCTPLAFGGGIYVEDGGATVTGNAQTIAPLIQHLTPLKISEIPGMSLLINTYEHLSIDPPSKKLEIEKIVPMPSHLYYRVDKNFADGPGFELIRMYANQAHVSSDKITMVHYQELGGTLRTLLLPVFFQSPENALAVTRLLSESPALIVKNDTEFEKLQNVIQAFLTAPDKAENYFNFYREIVIRRSTPALFLAYAMYDQKHQAAKSFDEYTFGFKYSDLLGQHFVDCWLAHPQAPTFEDCKRWLAPNPNYLLARSLAEYIQESDPEPGSWARLSLVDFEDDGTLDTKRNFSNDFYLAVDRTSSTVFSTSRTALSPMGILFPSLDDKK